MPKSDFQAQKLSESLTLFWFKNIRQFWLNRSLKKMHNVWRPIWKLVKVIEKNILLNTDFFRKNLLLVDPSPPNSTTEVTLTYSFPSHLLTISRQFPLFLFRQLSYISQVSTYSPSSEPRTTDSRWLFSMGIYLS